MTDDVGHRLGPPLAEVHVSRAGVQVSVTEVELAIARHPAVVDAAVIPVPDRALGEAVCACVVASSSHAPPRLAELREWLASDLAPDILPDELCIVNAIPRSDIGTVDRRALTAVVIGNGGVVHERLGALPPPLGDGTRAGG